MDDFRAVRQALEDQGIPDAASGDATMIPQNYVTLTDENALKLLNRTLDMLDEDDDEGGIHQPGRIMKQDLLPRYTVL